MVVPAAVPVSKQIADGGWAGGLCVSEIRHARVLDRTRSRRRAMTRTAENRILGHLRHIRGRVDQVVEDLGTVKLRSSSLESQVAGLCGDNAIAHRRMDRIESRLERIELRL